MKNAIFLVAILSSMPILAKFDETQIQIPLKNSNEQNLTSTICRTRDNLLWNICSFRFDNKEEMERSFSFSNDGGNKTVPQTGFGVGRSFEFMFEDFARSDLSLLLWDMPDEIESHGHLKLMMFFPRRILPAIRYDESNPELITVTLPTNEEVIFNAETKEIISGVLSEGAIAQDKEGYAVNPAINYSGAGVVVEADRLHDYPVGVSKTGKNNTATISKKGFRPCKILAKELWYTDHKKGGNVFFNKKYVTDEAFDNFLKKKCKFSMY